MYRVLKPRYERTGESFVNYEGKTVHVQRVEWIELGKAKDMKEAKANFCAAPVLEWIEPQPK